MLFFFYWRCCQLVHVSEGELEVLELCSNVQLTLNITEEESALDLCHLEEECENVQERCSGEKVGEVLYLFISGVDTSLL